MLKPLPNPASQLQELPSHPVQRSIDGGGPLRPVSWATAIRHRWIILGCITVVFGITMILTRRAVPIYESSATLRIEQQEGSLPPMFRAFSKAGRIETEIEELRSRTMAGGVVTELSLRLSLTEPQVTQRSSLLQDIHVADSAPPGDFRLEHRGGDRFALLDEVTAEVLVEVNVGQPVALRGFGFVLTPAAREHETIRFSIGSLVGAAAGLAGGIVVTQPSRDAEMVQVSYRSADKELAWKVPSALVTHYVAQRQELQSLETRSTIEFLREQITALSTQLGEAERELEAFRQRNEVIHPEAEATSQIGRLVNMQTQRGMQETERQAMEALLTEVDADARSRKPGDPSPYRRLLAFPTLLQSQAASGLLASLSAAEDERSVLLLRRQPEDPDVRALDVRIGELERELRAIAATYLQGLTNQVRSLDGQLNAFRQQLRDIPAKEMEYARLERQPKVLEGVYTLLQTRLKEAEVAAAARDPSVRVVDPPIPPGRPVSPKPLVNAAAALVCGLMLGLGAAFVLEYLDGRIRSRSDVATSAGLSVLGLIPRIERKGSPVVLIAEPVAKRGIPTRSAPPSTSPPASPGSPRGGYTFLGGTSGGEPAAEPVEAPRPPTKAPALIVTRLTISAEASVVTEAYGVLQTGIAFARPDDPVKVVVFTSPLSGDGKTTTVLNLALSLAQRGLRTLLIDADLRRGIVHLALGSPREPGLSEVLRDAATFDSAHRSVAVDEHGMLDYLASGRLRRGQEGLINSSRMGELLERARQEYDVVLVDTPPVNVITDAALLGARADGVVLVVRSGTTEAAALTYAVEQLRHVRANLLGVVLNDIDLRRDSAYDKSYAYFRGYEYTDSEA